MDNQTDETIEQRDVRMLTESFERAATVTASNINVEERTVELSFASEIEVERWYGLEVLEMSKRAADLNRLNVGGALLSDHNTRAQIGKVVKAWIGDDKRAHAIVKFSQRKAAQEEFQDVIDGIRTNVSFMYRVLDYKTERGIGNAPDKRTVTRWEAMEISLVSVPADASVGVGRAHENLGSDEQEQRADEPVATPVEAPVEPAVVISENNQRGLNMDQSTETGQSAATAPRFTREQEFIDLGTMFGQAELARQFALDPTKSIEELRTAMAEKYRAANNIQATPDEAATAGRTHLDLTEKEARKYSITNAILAQADGNWKNAEFERECHDEIVKRGIEQKAGGFFVPSDVQTLQRDLSVAGGTATGAALVGTDHMPGSFIEILRSKMRMLELGVTVMSGLVGNPSIPRQDGAATGYWVSEGVAPTESQQVFAQLGMSPKTCGAVTEFTRQLLVQSAPSVDQLVYSDLAAVLARTIDKAIIQGTGTAGQPTGILSTTGVSEVDMIGATFAFADAVAFETAVLEADAPEGTAWLCRPSVAGTLKSRPKIGSTYPVYLNENNSMNGYPVKTTTQLTSATTLLFGAFSTILLGEWGILEIEANRLGSGFRAGNIEVRGLHMVDVAVRYPQALKKLTAFA